MKVGDLVTAKHWLNKQVAVVVRLKRGTMATVVMTDGYTCVQYIHDLVVLNESR
jgi:hypothetical protein